MPKLSYIVLGCHDLVASKQFYEALGLVFQEEKHGSGPTHFSTDLSGITIELYPAKPGSSMINNPRRLGIVVVSIDVVRAALEQIGAKSKPNTHCFSDPDGRTIEIMEA